MAPPPPRAVVAIPPFLPGSLTRTTASGEDGGGRKDRASSPRHDHPSAQRVKFADHVLVGAPSSPSRPIFPSGEEDDDADRRRRMGDRTRAADAEDALASSTGTMTTTTTTIPPPTQPRQQQQQQQHQQPWRSRSIVAPPSHSSRPPSSSSFYSSTTSSHTSPTSSRDHIHQHQQHHQPKQRQQLDGVLRSKNARRILGILSLLVATRLSSYLGSCRRPERTTIASCWPHHWGSWRGPIPHGLEDARVWAGATRRRRRRRWIGARSHLTCGGTIPKFTAPMAAVAAGVVALCRRRQMRGGATADSAPTTATARSRTAASAPTAESK